MWDGKGRRGSSTCCEFNNPPLFCKDLPQPTTDDIELRLCADESLVIEDVYRPGACWYLHAVVYSV